MQPLRVAVAGLGFMGATHARAIRQIVNIDLAGIVSGDPKKLSGDLRDTGGNLGLQGEVMDFSQVRKYRTLAEALKEPDIDAVDLCLPTHLHANAAIEALHAGKHVLLEKPMALDGASADRILRAAEASGRMFMVGHVLRFLPPYREARERVSSGSLGKIEMVWLRRNAARPSWGGWLSDPTLSGGAVLDLLIHDIDFAIGLFGAPADIQATVSGDLITATFGYPNTGPVTIEGGWHTANSYAFNMGFSIAGETGTLEYASGSAPLTLSRAGAIANEILPAAEFDGFEEELRYFADCALTGTQPDLCPPAQSALAVRTARRILDAGSKG